MGKVYPKGSEVIALKDLEIVIPREYEFMSVDGIIPPIVDHIATSGQKGFLTEDFRPEDTYASIKWEWHDHKDSVLFEYGKDFRFTE